MSFVREMSDLIRFYLLPKNEKDIVIYSENEGYFPYFEGLIRELTLKHKRTVCYFTSDISDEILDNTRPGVKAFYINKLLIYFMMSIETKVFIMTLSELGVYHIKRSLYPVHYVYICHSMVSTHMVDRKDAFDHYDSILCVGPHHVKEIRKREEIAGLPKKHLVEAGYYRLERIIGKYEICSPQKHVADRKCVLIAPSWGKKNIIESCGEKLCDILLGHGYKVIVRPHPETVKRSPEILKTIEAKFGNNPDFTLERSVKTDDSILQADHLICDYSGIALEYAFGTLRPVLFIDVPLKINNESYNDLGLEPIELSIRPIAGLTISPNDMDTVVQVLEKLESLKQDFHENIKSLRDRSIFNLGSSSAAGAEYIVKTLLKDQTV